MQRTKRLQRSMLEGPLLSGIILYAIPIILTGFLQLLFSAADMVVVGNYCGSSSVAAVSATGSLTSTLVTLFMGLSTGAGVAVAHSLGSRESESVHRTVHTAMPTALVCGVLLTVLGLVFSEDLLLLMNTPETILPLSVQYLQIYFAGMVFTMVYNFGAAILRAAGDTKSPLIYLAIAGVANVVLNLFFVLVLDMNVAGVAWGTTISQAISCMLVVRKLMVREDACKFSFRQMHFHKPQLLKIIRIGLPAGLEGSLFGISNMLIQSSVNSFGEIFLAGHAAAHNVDTFGYTAMGAFTQTAMNFVGQNTGAHQLPRARKAFRCCAACSFVLGASLSAVMLLFGQSLLGFFVPDSPEAIQYGMLRFRNMTAFFSICGVMDICFGTMRGMGSSVTPMILSVLGVCGFRILWIYTVFVSYHTPEVLYWSYPISWALTLAAGYSSFLILYNRKRKQEAMLTES